MILPDYAGGSIVNLMRSLGDACGAEPLPYAPLRDLDPAPLARARNLVLLVLDGVGDHYLATRKAGSRLRAYRAGRATSVFPSTTATAITTFMTGCAPRQHALTGWHMYLSEIDRVTAVLPLEPRGGEPFDDQAAVAARVFSAPVFFDRLQRTPYAVCPAHICDSPFNTRHSGRARRLPYQTPEEMFAAIESVLRQDKEHNFIYTYYPEYDSAAHRYGSGSEAASAAFDAVDAAFGAFLDRTGGCDFALVATADHGFIDSPPEHVVDLAQHPELGSMLMRPLCGERRAAYCYVRHDRRSDFEAYVKGTLSHCAGLFPSRALIQNGWFGPGESNGLLAERVGDYTLVMLDDWTIIDWVPGEKRYALIGVHGGVSAAEMYVPLIVVPQLP